MNYINQLLQLASSDISAEQPISSLDKIYGITNNIILDLNQLLRLRNGFWVFEQALHIFPNNYTADDYDLITWNSNYLWKNQYQDLVEDLIFFAEDIFGGQFAISGDNVCRFDPETGQIEEMASTLEEWAAQIIQNYEVETGFPLAHSWQEIHGILPLKHRLLPKIPFVLGGEYSLENLFLTEAVEGMKFRANLALQIRDLPDDANINFKIVE